MAPVSPIAMPASVANSMLGFTPVQITTISVLNSLPEPVLKPVTSPASFEKSSVTSSDVKISNLPSAIPVNCC